MVDAQQTVGQIDQKQIDDQVPEPPDQEEMWTILKLMKRYGIGKEPLYKRMAHLKIQPGQMGNCSYLDDEQLACMDSLHNHIQQTGRIILLQKLRGVIT